ncbi:hypothetical protein BET04_10410 [Caminicella sporogenes]|nr:hypothetical protein BET04_10410 [Caminicella sporogenes]
MFKKISSFIDNYNFLTQYVFITLSFMFLTIGMDICFYNIFFTKYALLSIFYQIAVKIFIIMPLIYLLLKQKEKINNIENLIKNKIDKKN